MRKLATLCGGVVAVALAIAVYLPTQASAMAVNQENWGSVGIGFTDTFATSHLGSGVVFDDTYAFTPNVAGASAIASTVNIPLPGSGAVFDITGLTADLVTTSGDPVNGPFAVVGAGVVQANGDIQMSAILTNGVQYAVRVQGTTAGSSGGFYAGEIHLQQVVPIPGAVWLFGSGVLGLLGVGYSRRRQVAA